MMTGTLRPATRADIRAIVRLWRQTRPYEDIEQEAVERFFDNGESFLPGAVLVAESDGDIVGFIAGVIDRPSRQGRIPAFFVHAEYIDGELADHLLNRVLDELGKHGAESVDTEHAAETGLWPSGYDSRYVEILDVFRRNGFEDQWRYHELDVAFVKNLTTHQVPVEVKETRTRLEKEGVSFALYRNEFRKPYLDFMQMHFSGYPAWCQGAKDYVEGRAGSGFRVLAFRDGEVVGFTDCRKPKDWSIYATGVREDLRRRGIGTVLIFLGVEEMKRRGGKRLYLGHAVYDFYRKLGGKVVYRFMVMRKKMPKDQQPDRGDGVTPAPGRSSVPEELTSAE